MFVSFNNYYLLLFTPCIDVNIPNDIVLCAYCTVSSQRAQTQRQQNQNVQRKNTFTPTLVYSMEKYYFKLANRDFDRLLPYSYLFPPKFMHKPQSQLFM